MKFSLLINMKMPNQLAFSYLLAENFSCSAMFSKKEFATVINLRSINRTNFMLSWVEHEKGFITSGPNKTITKTRLFKYAENFTTKKWKFSDKKIQIFFIFLIKIIDCGYALEPPRRGGSNAYPQSMFLSRNKKNNVYPCKPQFYYIKVGFKGVKII